MIIEVLYVMFLSIFEAAHKFNYVEIALSMIETLYSKAPFKSRKISIWNRTMLFYKPIDENKPSMEYWAIDVLIEHAQDLFRDVRYNVNGDESVKGLIHVMFNNKAKR